MTGVFLLLIFLPIFMGISFPQEGITYVPGRGLKVKPLRLTVGGYITFEYESREDYERQRLDDVALLMFGKPLRRFRYFAEFEFNDLYLKENGKESSNRKLYIERLYGDLLISETLKLRAGRFITPVGLWNPVHINVLKWTTSDPLTAVEFFPKFVTGVGLFGNLPYNFEYFIFYQNNRGISEEYNNYVSRKFYGAELKKEVSSHLRIGVNGGYFDLLDPDESLTFAGVNVKYRKRGMELSAEAMYGWEEERYLPGAKMKSYRTSYYLQGVYRVIRGNYAVLRYDYFKDKSDSKLYHIVTAGWNFRPFYFMALKVEYQLREKDELNTFLASFSWMF